MVSIQAQIPVVNFFAQQKQFPTELKSRVSKGTVYSINETVVAQLLQSKPAQLTWQFQFENKEWLIDLKQSTILSNGFFVTNADGGLETYNPAAILHYKGKIKGSNNSVAAISILHNEVIAVLADEKGNINIGALKNKETGIVNDHIIFREADLASPPPFECGAANTPAPNENPLPQFAAPAINAAVINTEPVDIYFEADYKCFQNNSNSITNTVNWATALFNVVTTLYENDSVYTRMSAIKIWNTPDPYIPLTTTATVLNAFSANMSTGFPGDLAHLLSQRSLGGGIAWLNVLCNSAYYRTGLSANLSNAFNSFPVYSWSSMVITHELGHNIASNHTQWCGWPGGAIDNCYTTEGGCAMGPAPVNGGTIMSYCHLTAYGINLANGFGPLPGAAIRNAVRTSTCIFPRINFSSSAQNVTEEEADVENNCLDYKIMNVKLAVNYTPSQPAVISLIATNVASPTLQIGADKDVEISPMSFSLSDTTPQNIQLKIYDDALIENKETLKLDYNLAANGTNALKNGTYLLNIFSLDHRPDSTINQVLYYEPFDGISAGLGAWTQTIVYGAASPNRWMIGNTADSLFAGTAAYISANGTSQGYAGSSLSDSAVIRLESPLINATGFTNMRLSYLYKCLGENSSVQGGGGLDFGKVYYSTNAGSNWNLLKTNIYGRDIKSSDDIALPASTNNSATFKIAFEWLNNSSIVNNPAFILDSILIKGTSTAAIQTTAHAANVEEGYLGPNQTVHFYNPVTQNIMASISNKSSFDFGCTTVEMIRTGDSAALAWGDYTAQKVAKKSYRVIPANSNAAAPYEISLYYTNEEINGWAATTKNAVSDIAIVKTSGDITQTPPATLPEYSNYNSIVNYGSSNHKVITAAFTGFSTFSIAKAGITPLCAGAIKLLPANETGTAYQWQVNNGGGYINITNNALYNGATAATLSINSAPSSWYGYKYRCNISNALGTHYSLEYSLKFAANWMGSSGNAWENLSNWECGSLPDSNTDVFIKPGAGFYPVINSNTGVRSLTLQSGSRVDVKTGVQVTILQ